MFGYRRPQPMFGYRTPGVYFEWVDVRPPAISILRTDIAGFVGIAARGPLHQPVKVESWTQFTSTFGGHIPQGYLAYAVEGFFANGGQTCWVVRVADSEQARPASLDLLDSVDQPTLRLTASSPGVWGQHVTVSLARVGGERFSLTVRLAGGETEMWRNLTMKRDAPRYVETVLNDEEEGSRLVVARDLDSPAGFPANMPSPRASNLLAGTGRLAGGWDGLAPSFELLDRTRQPTLRLTAIRPGVYSQSPRVSVARNGPGRFTLTVQPGGGAGEVWSDLTMGAMSIDLRDRTGKPTLAVVAAPDLLGKKVTVHVEETGANRFALTVRVSDGRKEVWSDLTMERNNPRYVEVVLNDLDEGSRLVSVCDLESPSGFPQNTPDPQASNLQPGGGRLDPDPRYVETVLNDPDTGSDLVTVHDLHSPARFPANTPDPWATNLKNRSAQLAGGLRLEHLSGEGAPADQRWGLANLEAIDEVSIVAMPDIMPKPWVPFRQEEQPLCCDVLDETTVLPAVVEGPLEFPPFFNEVQILTLQQALIRHCEKLKDRVAVLDDPPNDPAGIRTPRSPADVIDWRKSFDTKYAALYYPWLKVPDPLNRIELLRNVPPSGHVAGVYARGDLAIGVHKPPANEALRAVQDVLTPVNDIQHGDLNTARVNVIRPYNGRGVRVAGARTLSSDLEWRFINVRRLLIMIEEALDEQLQWTVFEPNNRNLWRDVDRVVRSFLDRIWRLGMLDGATAEDAYHVQCDETTNPPQETEQGRLICKIGVRPPWPAEFVIVRIGITEGGTEISEESGAF